MARTTARQAKANRDAQNASLKKTSQGSVQVVKRQTDTTNANTNSEKKVAGMRAKSGRAAKEGAERIVFGNDIQGLKGKGKTVKVNSATPTRQGITPTPSRAGGLMGGGGAGNWRNMFK